MDAMETITIRPMREQDAKALMEIENAIWTHENSPDVLVWNDVENYWERRRDTPTLVADASGVAVGFLCYDFPSPLRAHRYQWDIAMGLHPDWQNRGIGGRLMDAVKRLARDEGIHKLSLRVLESNGNAIRFYKRQGFVQEAYFRDEFFIEGAFRGDCQFAFFLE